MNIIQPYSRLIGFDADGWPREFTERHGIALLRKIEWNARISHRSEDKQTDDSWRRFITSVVMEHGDWSVVEHAHVTVDTIVDRGITHEWVRHRLFSFTQESTRFVNYEKKVPPSFIDPTAHVNYAIGAGNADAGGPSEHHVKYYWQRAVDQCEESYRLMIQAGVSPQIARSVFPNALASRISTSGNLRNWRHFFIMRTTKEAHPQMRQVSIPLLEEFKAKIPLLFDDLEPMARQADNLRKPK